MSALAASTEHKPILAERFKTKVCRTFAETGSCPYEARCMFAHGAADLRSKEMNIKDGLVTEEAIRVFLVARLTAARQVVDSNGEVRTSILAERFKTKMCQNYERRGACPYEARCMFAHGDHDLRTAAQNTEDGLTSEDAIRAFQRTGKLPAKPAAKKAAKVAPSPPTKTAATPMPMPSPAASATSLPAADVSFESSRSASQAHTPRAAATSPPSTSVTPVKGRRHNPYAPVVFGFPTTPCEPSHPYAVSPLAAVMLAHARPSGPKTIDAPAPQQQVVLLA